METGHDSLEAIRGRVGERTIKALADEAQALEKTYGKNNIKHALRNYQRDDFSALAAIVREELRRRKRAAVASASPEKAPSPKTAPPSEKLDVARLMPDAYAHEKHQPADTYDAEAEEEARKPLSNA